MELKTHLLGGDAYQRTASRATLSMPIRDDVVMTLEQ